MDKHAKKQLYALNFSLDRLNRTIWYLEKFSDSSTEVALAYMVEARLECARLISQIESDHQYTETATGALL